MDNRYYFEKLSNVIELDKTETQHLSKVRRAKVGDVVIGFCGDGFDYKLKIEEINKTAKCRVIDKTKNKATDITPITVFLSTLKNEALSECIDNLTQLNVKTIVIFDTKYSVASIDNNKIEKLKNRSIQACKQCERADKPDIFAVSYNEVLNMLLKYDLILFAYENSSRSFINDLKNYKGKKIALIVGCEGGFSSKEVEELGKYSRMVSLGKTILRAPVAATSFTACVLSGLGEWNEI